ncbi:uncharacterized protein LOC121404959 [Drosophila obscura]|uniref:uncharacterized protein LOC121404959 n=1 Tax=Drosophila obscura TaxID=7282 RepID=UPI001BB21F83|nr:uncharacterized protein LOC121404959 [Drosophila obscura]XP_041451316.1 uncharacterized protein LOC121404959 [Drosophila obscura]
MALRLSPGQSIAEVGLEHHHEYVDGPLKGQHTRGHAHRIKDYSRPHAGVPSSAAPNVGHTHIQLEPQVFCVVDSNGTTVEILQSICVPSYWLHYTASDELARELGIEAFTEVA